MIITTAIFYNQNTETSHSFISTAAAIEQQKNFSNQRAQTSSYRNFSTQTLYLFIYALQAQKNKHLTTRETGCQKFSVKSLQKQCTLRIPWSLITGKQSFA
jgi:hypothetical protein